MNAAASAFPLPAAPWGMLVMFIVAGVLIHLAIKKEYEPTLLLPIGFGALLGNLPNSPLNHPGGLLYILNDFGVKTEIFPLFIFVGIGALMDFRPLLSQPVFALMGAAGQFGIFATLILATAFGFPLNQASSILIFNLYSEMVCTRVVPPRSFRTRKGKRT